MVRPAGWRPAHSTPWENRCAETPERFDLGSVAPRRIRVRGRESVRNAGQGVSDGDEPSPAILTRPRTEATDTWWHLRPRPRIGEKCGSGRVRWRRTFARNSHEAANRSYRHLVASPSAAAQVRNAGQGVSDGDEPSPAILTRPRTEATDTWWHLRPQPRIGEKCGSGRVRWRRTFARNSHEAANRSHRHLVASPSSAVNR